MGPGSTEVIPGQKPCSRKCRVHTPGTVRENACAEGLSGDGCTPTHQADTGYEWGTFSHALLKYAMRHREANHIDLGS
jgi:hypothetical protein